MKGIGNRRDVFKLNFKNSKEYCFDFSYSTQSAKQ